MDITLTDCRTESPTVEADCSTGDALGDMGHLGVHAVLVTVPMSCPVSTARSRVFRSREHFIPSIARRRSAMTAVHYRQWMVAT